MHNFAYGPARRARSRVCLFSLVLFAAAATCSAVETKFWQQSDQSDFDRGTSTGISLRSDGRLFLAPAFPQIFESTTPYLWTAVSDSKGTLYVAGGGSGNGVTKLFAVDAAGKSRTVAELPGLEIHALAVNSHDQLFAATAPDGKIYRIPASGKPEPFYDPKAKYIWALAFDVHGDLFVATGDGGEVHRVTPDGKGSVFFKTEQTHARSLAVLPGGDLIVGTEPDGLVVRVSSAGKGFVLYQSSKREITAVVPGPNGEIYAAGVGNRPTGPAMPAPIAPAPIPSPPMPGTAASPAAPITVIANQNRGATLPSSFALPTQSAVTGGSDLYRIDPDGAPHRIWTNAQDIVYAIGFDAVGKPLLGTGNRGKIYRVDSDVLSTVLLDAPPTQITAFCKTPAGKLYAITGNIGAVYQLGPGEGKSGSYESEVLDGGSFTYWGRLQYRASASGVSLFTRTGNVSRAQENWSAWAPLEHAPASGVEDCAGCSGGRIASPPARFFQYKIALSGSGGNSTPELSSLEVAYLPKNVAPQIDAVEIGPPNYRFPAPVGAPTPSTPPTSITLPPIGTRRHTSSPSPSTDLALPQTLSYQKGWTGVRWQASDENGDTLLYTVEIRGTQESSWKLLKDKVRDKYVSFDTTAFPDGEYQVRVTASDAPSNPPAQALSCTLIGDPFLIDNTPPQVLNLNAKASGAHIEVRWTARDARSIIDKAEYSVNGGEWTVIDPVTKLSDSPEEQYQLSLDREGAAEQTIAVRVTDYFDNQTVGKVVVK